MVVQMTDVDIGLIYVTSTIDGGIMMHNKVLMSEIFNRGFFIKCSERSNPATQKYTSNTVTAHHNFRNMTEMEQMFRIRIALAIWSSLV